jgi:predicted amidophosphoribosyltransferase
MGRCPDRDAEASAVYGAPVEAWWRAARAAWAFPHAVRRVASAAAWHAARGSADGAFSRGFGEVLGARHCLVCCTDDVAVDGWVALDYGMVCAECSAATLAGTLAYGRTEAAFRGRVGSPRRALGEVYQAIVAFKERRGDWASLAHPLARALALSVTRLLEADDDGAPPARRLVVPVPSYRGRRPHMRMLTALACVPLRAVVPCLQLLSKERDFMQKGLTRSERREESAQAYVVRARWRAAVRGRHVIVADDLITTGATLDACAAALREAGAAAVDGAAIVRVVRAPPERMLSFGARQVRVQLRELDGRGRTPVANESGVLWVQFACSDRCPITATAGPFPLPRLDAVGYHRWSCRCGTSHVVRLRREWRGDARESVAVGVGDRRPPELLVGIVQGPPAYVR